MMVCSIKIFEPQIVWMKNFETTVLVTLLFIFMFMTDFFTLMMASDYNNDPMTHSTEIILKKRNLIL